MGSKTKALIEIARVLASVGAGYLVYYEWATIRHDPAEYPIAAGVVVTVMAYLLLKKLNKGSGSD